MYFVLLSETFPNGMEDPWQLINTSNKNYSSLRVGQSGRHDDF